MPTFRLRRLRPSTSDIDARSLGALAMLLLLVQAPHAVHLPWWVSGAGAAVIGARWLALKRPWLRALDVLLSSVALSLFALAAAFAIRAHYGYFVGRDPSVAFLFLLVSAKFAELRQTRDATLLLCLASFLLLTQYFYSQSILAAVLTLPAVLALGHALAVVRDPARAAPAPTQLKLVGKLLLQGAPLAALLFVVFPRLPGPLWSLPEDAAATTGLSDTMTPGSIGALSLSDEVAFRVEFDGPPPPGSTRYWRGPVLDRFDGRGWSAGPSRPGDGVEAAGAGAGATVDYTVMLQPHRTRWLFALERPASLPRRTSAVDVSADVIDAGDEAGDSADPTPRASADMASRALARLSADGQLLAPEPVTQVLRYRQSSTLSDRRTDVGRPARTQLALAGANPRSLAFARELRAKAPDDAGYARAVLAHFAAEPFRYTLRPQLLGDAPVDEFLFDSREGFCEHYASAFAVLMRAAGIPTRIVTGYLGGEMNGDYMIVRQSDAHAWTEAWIDGAWQRFDPTGAVAPSRVEAGVASALPSSDLLPRFARLDGGWLRAAGLRWDRVNHDWQRFVVDFDDDSQAELLQRLGLDRPLAWQLTAAVLACAGAWCVLVLGVPWPARLRIALGARRTPPAERAWRRLERLLARHGLARGVAESPARWLARARETLPDQAGRLASLEARFGGLRFAALDEAALRHELRAALRELRRLRRALPAGARRTSR